MGRTIIVEERVQGDLGRLSGSQRVQIGLLVGQVSKQVINRSKDSLHDFRCITTLHMIQVTVQKDYVVFFIRTPSVSDVCKDGGEFSFFRKSPKCLYILCKWFACILRSYLGK